MKETSETSSYRLRPPVRVQEKNGKLFLLSAFPLKAMIFNTSWRPAFDLLSKGDWVFGEEMAQRMTAVDPRKVESFLDDLVRKGYLEQRGLPALHYFPLVSVIVPVRNRAEEIASCLESLLRVRYPSEKLDLIVVDDASEDRTPQVVSGFPVHLISMSKR
ncbi:MAG: glycosyl transferase family 2, partial [Deltaproteobacteria bacterium]|nr:glycosyl transferase family 2 [Deltaproteobacteria bacterium]